MKCIGPGRSRETTAAIRPSPAPTSVQAVPCWGWRSMRRRGGRWAPLPTQRYPGLRCPLSVWPERAAKSAPPAAGRRRCAALPRPPRPTTRARAERRPHRGRRRRAPASQRLRSRTWPPPAPRSGFGLPMRIGRPQPPPRRWPECHPASYRSPPRRRTSRPTASGRFTWRPPRMRSTLGRCACISGRRREQARSRPSHP